MGILAGLAAALAWTVASSIWRSLATSLTAIQLNGLKNVLACGALLPVLITLPWINQTQPLLLLLLSGGLGISLGDTFYFAALRRLGTRRTLTLESLSPVAAACSGWLAMGERLSAQAWAGALVVTVSVMIVAQQQPPDATRMPDRSRGAVTEPTGQPGQSALRGKPNSSMVRVRSRPAVAGLVCLSILTIVPCALM